MTVSDPRNLVLGRPRPPLKLSEAFVDSTVEAAEVCFDHVEQPHLVSLRLQGFLEEAVLLHRKGSSEAQQATYALPRQATELGAVALAGLLVHELTDELVVRVSLDGTRFDYWLSPRDEERLRYTAGLEISGILRENVSNTIEQRIHEKRVRLEDSAWCGPVRIIVAAFSEPRVRMDTYDR